MGRRRRGYLYLGGWGLLLLLLLLLGEDTRALQTL